MIFLIGSIVLSSYLTLAFKVCEKYGISIFQAILFNYITCIATGSIVNGSHPFTSTNFHSRWFPWAVIMGAIFILVFNITGYTTQKIGVAVASVANKLSLVIPFIFSIYLFNEPASWIKIAAIIIALIAVALTCYPSQNDFSHAAGKHISAGWKDMILPAVLFIGSGLSDSLVNYVSNPSSNLLTKEDNNAYLVTGFTAAFCIGTVILIVQVLRKKAVIQSKAIIAGICIGVPNYFSIWCLVKVLNLYSENSSAIIPVNNMGIVLFSAVMAWLLFKEKLSFINWTGIILSVAAIAMIAFG